MNFNMLFRKKIVDGSWMPRNITLIKTKLNLLVIIMTERLRSVAEVLWEPEQNYAMKGRTIQNNLHMICMIIESVKNDDESAIINLDQANMFYIVDHQ